MASAVTHRRPANHRACRSGPGASRGCPPPDACRPGTRLIVNCARHDASGRGVVERADSCASGTSYTAGETACHVRLRCQEMVVNASKCHGSSWVVGRWRCQAVSCFPPPNAHPILSHPILSHHTHPSLTRIPPQIIHRQFSLFNGRFNASTLVPGFNNRACLLLPLLSPHHHI